MAGSTNSPSVIWVAGEAEGRNEVGAVVTVSGYLPPSLTDILTESQTYADAAVAVLRNELVASGVL